MFYFVLSATGDLNPDDLFGRQTCCQLHQSRITREYGPLVIPIDSSKTIFSCGGGYRNRTRNYYVQGSCVPNYANPPKTKRGSLTFPVACVLRCQYLYSTPKNRFAQVVRPGVWLTRSARPISRRNMSADVSATQPDSAATRLNHSVIAQTP
jgi:hypothetical protein